MTAKLDKTELEHLRDVITALQGAGNGCGLLRHIALAGGEQPWDEARSNPGTRVLVKDLIDKRLLVYTAGSALEVIPRRYLRLTDRGRAVADMLIRNAELAKQAPVVVVRN